MRSLDNGVREHTLVFEDPGLRFLVLGGRKDDQWPDDAREMLPNYYRIACGAKPPTFKRARQKPAVCGDGPLTEPLAGLTLDRLWELHEASTARYDARPDPDDETDEKDDNEEESDDSAPNDRPTLLDLKIATAKRLLHHCCLCEHRCGVDRTAGARGRCGVLEPHLASEFIHWGEEPELVPSLTLFFAGCTFECVFCQNWDISQDPRCGSAAEPAATARRIDRRATQARNVNWVGGDPTSNLPFILETLKHCTADLPQVWNSNLYLSPESLRLLDGVIDCYLSDFKYGPGDCAARLSKCERYWEVLTRNHMHIAARDDADLIVRHLVMPNHVECCSLPIIDWLAENIERARVNIMAQYRPEYHAHNYDDLARPVHRAEVERMRDHARARGLSLTR